VLQHARPVHTVEYQAVVAYGADGRDRIAASARVFHCQGLAFCISIGAVAAQDGAVAEIEDL